MYCEEYLRLTEEVLWKLDVVASSIVEEDLDMPIWGMRAGMTASERFRYRRRIMQ